MNVRSKVNQLCYTILIINNNSKIDLTLFR